VAVGYDKTTGHVLAHQGSDDFVDEVGGDFAGYEPCNAGVFAEVTADEDVEAIDLFAIGHDDGDAGEADIGDVVLCAGIGAAADGEHEGHVELDLLLEVLEDGTGAVFGLDDGEVAELLTGATDQGVAPEGCVGGQAELVEFAAGLIGLLGRDVEEEKVLFMGESQVALRGRGEALGKIGNGDHLIGGPSAAGHGNADVAQAVELLTDAHVVGELSADGMDDEVVVFESVAEAAFDFVAEPLPAIFGDEELEAGMAAFVAEGVGVAEDSRDDAEDGGHEVVDEVLGDEDPQTLGEMGFGGEAATDHDAQATLLTAGCVAEDGEGADVVDLGEVAVQGAGGDGRLELAG